MKLSDYNKEEGHSYSFCFNGDKKFEENWDKIFGKKLDKKEESHKE